MLVGNKLDLVKKDQNLREVSKDEAESFAKEENLMFVETSAFTDDNVKDAFENLL
jgi:GTPase SAR1 family protein